MNLDKIATNSDLRKAIEESALSDDKKQEIFITKFTRGLFAAANLLRRMVNEKEKEAKP